jgi:hypothetical protein
VRGRIHDPLVRAGGERQGLPRQRASLDADQTWSDLPTPSQIMMGSDGGIPFLADDDAHHVLYASMFSGGVARMVVP